MTSANASFEKRIYDLSRYFWNFSVVVGLASIGLGGILYANSFKKNIQPFGNWVKGQGENSSESYYDYEQRIKFHNQFQAPQNREDSKLFAGGGVGLILLCSSMSVIYSIERNTRKD